MTIEELRAVTAPVAATLEDLCSKAQGDDFAPWVVEALRRAAFYASLSPDALKAAQHESLEYVG